MEEKCTVYAPLGKKRKIKYPFHLFPGTEVIITNIHPADDVHFSKADDFIGKQATFIETSPDMLYARAESISHNPMQRSFVACFLKIEGQKHYMTAVRFKRAYINDKTFKKHVRQGKV